MIEILLVVVVLIIGFYLNFRLLGNDRNQPIQITESSTITTIVTTSTSSPSEVRAGLSSVETQNYLYIPSINLYSYVNTDCSVDLTFDTLTSTPQLVCNNTSTEVILGHRTIKNSPSHFSNLNNVIIGDEFIFNERIYQINSIEVVNPDNVWDEIINHSSDLALVTCTPYGTSLNRLVVFANKL